MKKQIEDLGFIEIAENDYGLVRLRSDSSVAMSG